MKHSILTIFVFATLQLSNANICAQNSEWEWMTVGNQKIKVDDKRCYLIQQVVLIVIKKNGAPNLSLRKNRNSSKIYPIHPENKKDAMTRVF